MKSLRFFCSVMLRVFPPDHVLIRRAIPGQIPDGMDQNSPIESTQAVALIVFGDHSEYGVDTYSVCLNWLVKRERTGSRRADERDSARHGRRLEAIEGGEERLVC